MALRSKAMPPENTAVFRRPQGTNKRKDGHGAGADELSWPKYSGADLDASAATIGHLVICYDACSIRGKFSAMKASLFWMFALWAANGSALAAATHRHAEPRSTPPMQIWGFALDQPSTLIPCPTGRDGTFDSRSWSASLDSTCLEPATRANTSADGRAKTLPVHFSRSEEPLLARGVRARSFALLILDGAVQGIFVRTSGADSQDAIYAMLRKKYGVPTALLKKNEGKSAGISANWRFPHLRVRFEGSAETVGEGSLSITTASADDYAIASPTTAAATR